MSDLDSKTMRQALFDATLAPLPRDHDNPDLSDFYRLLRDYPERGGKGLRGLILLYATEAHGLPWRASLEVAAGLELFQNWVLIHDDIEDDSEDRRGKPALHRSVGMPLALNVGDALHIYMWQCLHILPDVAPDVHQRILTEFVQMIHRTAEGQHLDLCWVAQGRFDVSEADYLEMVTLKTAYYTVIAPLRLGALRNDLVPDPRFTQAGVDLGVAFQIRDDVLNLSRDVAYGKEFAGDLYEAKRTLILAHLFAHATTTERDEVYERLAKARDAKTDDDIEAILGYVEQYGSLTYAQEVAETRAKRGMTLLREACAELPGQTGAAALLGLVDSVARRRQ